MRAQVVLPVLLGPTGPPDGICFIHLKNQGYSARADNGEVCLWLLSALQCLASARPECRSHQTFDRCRSWSATLARRGGAFDPPSIGVAAGSGASSRARDECGAGGWPTARHPDPHRGLGEPPPAGRPRLSLRDSGPSSVCAAFRPEQWSRGPSSCSDTRIACRSALACARDCVGRAEGPRFSAGRGQGRGGKVGCLCSLDTGRVRRRKGLRRGRTTAGHSMPLAPSPARVQVLKRIRHSTRARAP
jgi:hypothetical protein